MNYRNSSKWPEAGDYVRVHRSFDLREWVGRVVDVNYSLRTVVVVPCFNPTYVSSIYWPECQLITKEEYEQAVLEYELQK